MNGLFAQVGTLDLGVMVVYFAVVVIIGLQVGKLTRTTKDFFFAGQRFAWWIVAISCVATLVGSYSFQSYSQIGYLYGLSSMMPYTNDWFVLPIFLIGWLPIIYYSRVQSIPEYFERRFDRRVRIAVLVLLLAYLEIYIGINVLTIGELMHGVVRWDLFGFEGLNVFAWAALMAVISASYLHRGGQTSVLVTDLVQGFLLIAVGLGVFLFGVRYLGGFSAFWQGLPETHRMPLAQFNGPPGYHAVGDFWNDAVVGTFAFFCINQGVLMRFLSVKSVRDGRKAMIVVVLVLMPIAAVAVSGAGWIGKSMETHGVLPENPKVAEAESSEEARQIVVRNIFVDVAREVLSWPGMFGLVVAAVIAALMSTLDTLITAVSAVAVNDIWREVRPGRDDAHYLRAARHTAIGATALGLALIPLLSNYESIYAALSAFTSGIVPPLLVVILLGMTWRRFTARAAFWTVFVGVIVVLASVPWPGLIRPFAHGASPDDGFIFMRALFGLIVSFALAIGLTALEVLFFKRGATDGGETHEGLMLGTLEHARRLFKGGEPSERGVGNSVELPMVVVDGVDDGDSEVVRLPQHVMDTLEADVGDMIYISDARWWLGGFRALNTKAGPVADEDRTLRLSRHVVEAGHLLPDRPVRVEKVL